VYQTLADALTNAALDERIRVVLLHGNNAMFTAGNDLVREKVPMWAWLIGCIARIKFKSDKAADKKRHDRFDHCAHALRKLAV
jgi:enoyl-CoA hydratase/carnithine racemase